MLIKLIWAPAAVLVLHVIAMLAGWYQLISWLDSPMHFLGGIAIATSAYFFWNGAQITSKQFRPILLKLLFILAIVALAAVAWEFLEFGLDRTFGTVMQPSVQDTIKDLALGLLGGSFISAFLLYKNR